MNTSEITTGLASLHINGAPSVRAAKKEHHAEKSPNRDLLLLAELGILGTNLLAPFDVKSHSEPQNLEKFLDGDLTGKSSIRTLLNIVLGRLPGNHTAPSILGEDIRRVLGWEYIQGKYLELVHQKDPSLSLTDCLSEKTIKETQNDCQQPPKNLTIRIPLKPTVQNSRALITRIHENLKLVLNSSLSDLSDEEPCSFNYESTVDGEVQTVRFEFPTNPVHSELQICLNEQYLCQGQPGNYQWCIDTMLGLSGKNVNAMMLGYVRDGINTRGAAERHVQNELSVVQLYGFWESCSVAPEHKQANALALCQLCLQAEPTAQARATCAESMYSFITKILEDSNAKTLFIEHLLYSTQQQIKQIGVELLVGLPANAEFKCKWISKSLKAAPEIARRLIQQIEGDSTVTENFVEQWLRASPENNRPVICHDLITSKSGRWVGLCIDCTPPLADDVKKAMLKSLRPFVAKCLENHNHERAVRFMKAYHDHTGQGFSPEDKTNLLLCMEQPMSRDLVDWYFTLHAVNGTIPYKFLPASQLRVFLAILQHTPDAIEIKLSDYIQELYWRITDLDEKAKLASEITEAKELCTIDETIFDNIFSPFFPKQAESQQVEVAVVSAKKDIGLHECLDPKAIRTNKVEIAAILKELDARSELKTTEKTALRTLLKPFVAEAMKQECYSLAVRFVKVHQMHKCANLDANVLSDLKTCAQERLEEDLAAWYLAQGYTKDPAGQMRAVVRIAQDHPACMTAVRAVYIKSLYDGIHDRAARESLQRDIKQLQGVSNHDELFKAFFPAVKVKKAPPMQPISQKAQSESAASWIQKLQALADALFFDELGAMICKLLARKDSMPSDMSQAIWKKIITNPQWLNTPQTLVVFEKVEYFKKLAISENGFANALAALLALLRAHPQEATKYLPFAYQWYMQVPISHSEKIQLGMSLLSWCKTSDSQTAIIKACKVVDEVAPLLSASPIFLSPSQSPHEPTDALAAFCVAVKPFQAVAEVRGATLRLVVELGKIESEAAQRLAVTHFWDNPDNKIKEALWPSVKKIMALIKEKTSAATALHLPIANLHRHLLQTAGIETLLEMLEQHFLCKELNILENSASEALLERKNLEAAPELTNAFIRLIELCNASSTPEHFQRYFSIDVSINKFHPSQAKQISDTLKNFATKRLKLYLRYIQHNGFDVASNLLLTHVLSCKDYESFYTSANSFRFYSYAQKFCDKDAGVITLKDDEQIGSVCPVNPANSESLSPEVNLLLRTALEFAKKNKKNHLQRNRLLDFAVQTVRNLMECHPQITFPIDCLQIISECIAPVDPLFNTHRTIVSSLLRKAYQRGVIAKDNQVVAGILSSINNEPTDLGYEDLAPLESIKGRLAAAGQENIVEVLIAEQKNFLVWQESLFVRAYEARQSVIDACLAVWKQHPTVLRNKAVLESMKAIMLPNSIAFGLNDGELGKKAAMKQLESHFDCYYEVYKSIIEKNPNGAERHKIIREGIFTYITGTDDAELALLCLNTMITECKNAKHLHLFDGQYDRLVLQLEKIIELFAKPCHLNCLSLLKPVSSLTHLILEQTQDAADRVKRAELAYKWLNCVQTLKGRDNADLIIIKVSNDIAKSTCVVHFSLDALQTLLTNVDATTRAGLLASYKKMQQKSSKVADNTMNCLFLICHTWRAQDPNGAFVKVKGSSTLSANGKVAKGCIETMIACVRKANEVKQYEGSYESFASHAMQIMMLLAKPCFVGLDSVDECRSAYIDILVSPVQSATQEAYRASLLYEWLQVIRTYRQDPIYKTVLAETIDKMIDAKIICAFGALKEPEQEVLLECLEDLKKLQVNRSPLLEASLILQLNQARIAREFRKAHTIIAEALEELE